MKTPTKKLHRRTSQGFSLVEFIVILTLFAIMASVTTFDYQRYRSKIERSNFATDIALAFRQMQVYGISSSNRLIGGVGFENDDEAIRDILVNDLVLDVGVYGVEVDVESQTLTLYQEVGDNELAYDEGTDLLIDILQVNGDNRIMRICATDSSQQPDIDVVNGTCASSREIATGTFSVSFKRPFPDARFYATALDHDFDITMAVLVVGNTDITAPELRYVYFDAVGLIQVIEPNFVN